MTAPIDVLLLEVDANTCASILSALPAKWVCESVLTPAEAEHLLNTREVKVLLCSDDLPEETGLMFLARTKECWPKLQRILLAADLDGELFFHAMREVSIFDYITKPIVPAELTTAVARARMQYDAAERIVTTGLEPSLPDLSESTSEKPAKSWPREGALVVGGFVAGASFTIALLLLLYLVKSQSGIDLYPMIHFWDLFEP